MNNALGDSRFRRIKFLKRVKSELSGQECYAGPMSDLFLHFLKDMYYAEQQFLKALPRFTQAARSRSAESGSVRAGRRKPAAY